MLLRDYDWKHSYATSDLREDGHVVDILHEFYIPALKRASRYDRVAGFFTSSSLAAASQGFSGFVENDGQARFVVGTRLDPEDAAVILAGDQQRLSHALLAELEPSQYWLEGERRGVELLAWMLANKHLQIRVGLRVHRWEGSAQPHGFRGDGYLHEKWAIIGDGRDELFVSGSLNESRTALEHNAENITVDVSWEARCRETLKQKHRNFEALWGGTHPAIKTFTLPEAVERKLVDIAERVGGLVEIDGTSPKDLKPGVTDIPKAEPDFKDRLPFAFLRVAPLLPGGDRMAMETAPIEPWPHQRFVAQRLLEIWPANQLLCDEVGLGKTIEAGLVFRALWLTGKARSIRVFAPASLTSQWLWEMADKFYLPFVRRVNRRGRFERVDQRTGQLIEGDSLWFEQPLEIISTGLIINRRGGRLLANFPQTDVVMLDEAHKARRQSPDNRAITPRFNKLYQELEKALYAKSRSLYLATATPMQLNRVEAFDLLRLMPSAGLVQFSEDLCDIFYQLREKTLADDALEAHELVWLQRYLRDVRKSSPTQWDFVTTQVLDTFGSADLNTLVDEGKAPFNWANLQQALTLMSPLGRSMLRHTRSLLRLYQREGLLNAKLARRHVEPVIIRLAPTEQQVYDRLQTYCEQLASHISANMEEGQQRAAIGFYLSFLRLRYASSFHALRCSLKRRLEKIERTLSHQAQQLIDSSLDRDELDELEDEQIEGLVLKNRTEGDLVWEQGAVSDLLSAMDSLPGTSSKVKRLLSDIEKRRNGQRVQQLVLFTRYTDTIDFLYKHLCRRLPDCPIGTFTGDGGSLRRSGANHAQPFDRTTIKQYFLNGHIDILLCSDAAAEGLNLQSADLLINFDLPWNPMLLEQRIGRIDRIGQQHDDIRVLNYLYQGSAEEVVYSRLVTRFREAITIAGELQYSLLPIQEKDFEDFAKTSGEEGAIDEEELMRRAEQYMKRIEERQHLTEFESERQKSAYESLERQMAAELLPSNLEGIWKALCDNAYLKEMGGCVESFSEGQAYRLHGIPHVPDGALLTTSRTLFEQGVGSEEPHPVHFATWGDPVFESLLNFMAEPFIELMQAWDERTPLASLRVNDQEVSVLNACLEMTLGATGDLMLNERRSRSKIEDQDRPGRLQETVLRQSAAWLAERKLQNQPDSASNQISNIERFARDLQKRPDKRVRLCFDASDHNAMLAMSQHFLWPVERYDQMLAMMGDPLLVQAIEELIRRQLGDLKKNQRTASSVAAALRR